MGGAGLMITGVTKLPATLALLLSRRRRTCARQRYLAWLPASDPTERKPAQP